MSRILARRWELSGTLVALSPVHVGNVDDTVGGELAQARDGLDRPVLPGTALAGVIRAALPTDLGDDPLWGGISGRTDKGGDDGTGQASWVWVDDATAPANTIPERRDTASIDRMTGGPAHGHLFTREVLPAGTTFGFRLAVDDKESNADSSARLLVNRIATLLCGSGVAVGGATSRGLGRVRLVDATLRRVDLATKAGMLAALRGQWSVEPTPKVDLDAVPIGVARIRVPWRPLGPVMVGVATDGTAIDTLPMTTVDGGNPRLVIPGSSIKGVLRSHAERITRTVLGADAPERFLDQMKGLKPVEELFGAAAERTGKDNHGRRGAVTVHECRSTVALPADLWEAILTPQPPDEPSNHSEQAGTGDRRDANADRVARTLTQSTIEDLNNVLAERGHDLRFIAATQVAVDRWTGSAAEGLLFAVLEPHTSGVDWEPIVIDVDLGRLGGLADQALVLVLLVLRDLCDGWIGFGRGVTRGMGAVRVSAEDVTFTAPTGAVGLWSEVNGRTLASLLDDADLRETLLVSWPPDDESEGDAA